MLQKLYFNTSPLWRVLMHVFMWMFYLAFYTLHWGSTMGGYLEQFQVLSIMLPAIVMATYFTLYFLMPRYLYTKKYVQFGLWLIISAVLFTMVLRASVYFFVYPEFAPQRIESGFWNLSKMLFALAKIYTVVLAAAAVKMTKRSYQHETLAQQLAQQKLDAELKFLKGQIHPHFLFNTLNNLYALTLQNSKNAPDVVIGLSRFLDYMLYDCNQEKVALEMEIAQIRNFIQLEKLRYGSRLDVNLVTSGDTTNKQVPPLLLLPFVENAFKHGVSGDIDESWIQIDIRATANSLKLVVENSLSNSTIPKNNRPISSGIGLRNVKRRLKILYQNEYELKIVKGEGTYMTILQIPIKTDIKLTTEIRSHADKLPYS